MARLILFIKMVGSVEEEMGFKGKTFKGPVFGHEYKTLSRDVVQIIKTQRTDITRNKNLKVMRSKQYKIYSTG